MSSASLDFQPAKLSLKVNETGNVDLRLSTNDARVIGVDVLVKFDPSALQIDQIQDDHLFNNQMGMVVDNKTGRLTLAMSNNQGVFTSKSGKIAHFRIKALKTSESKLSFDFSKGKTQDSNVVVAHGQDILTSVGQSVITIQPSATTGRVLGVNTSVVPQPVLNYPYTPIPSVSGSWLVFVLIGIILVAFGLYINFGRIGSWSKAESGLPQS